MNSPLPFVCRGAKAWGMARRHSPRHSFVNVGSRDDIIITCVRWYLRFKRELPELPPEWQTDLRPFGPGPEQTLRLPAAFQTHILKARSRQGFRLA